MQKESDFLEVKHKKRAHTGENEGDVGKKIKKKRIFFILRLDNCGNDDILDAVDRKKWSADEKRCARVAEWQTR